MSEAEIEFYERRLAKARVVLEYGCGGSTLMALASPADKIFSVESDPDWIARLRNVPSIVEAESNGRLELFHADVGPVGDWGTPEGPASPGWRVYPLGIWDRMGSAAPDLCLIDGRFRVACALAACTNAPVSDRTVVIHDFWNRPRYHGLLAFLDLQTGVDTLGVFTPKTKFDRRGAKALLRQSLTDPG